MLSRRRTLAALVLVMLVAAGLVVSRGAQGPGGAGPTITLDGKPLPTGTREVAPRPALGLLLPPGSGSRDFSAVIDGRPLLLGPGEGRAMRLQVGELAQGSRHHLEAWRGGPGPNRAGVVRVDFQVVEPLQLAASWLATPAGTTVQVSSSRELADAGALQAALVRAGASVRRDDRGVEGRWAAGRTAAFSVPVGLKATTGAFLPAEFAPALGPVSGAPNSRVDLSQPPGAVPRGLRLRAYYVAGPAARASLARHAAQISVLSPSFYAANPDGTLASSVDEQVISAAQAGGASIEPLVTNRDFSPTVARELFRSGAAGESLAMALVAEARRHGYAGYQLDFEGLGYGDRAALTTFSGQLSRRLAGAGLKYSTAVIPSKDTSGGGLARLFGHSGVYDYAELARGAGSMSVMAYDQHTAATDPGPVAGLDWVRQVTTATTAGLDRRRIDMGVPLYYRDWTLHGAATAGSYGDLVAAAVAHDGTVSWDFSSASPYVRYGAPGEEHVAWFENSTSLQAKLQVASQLGFGGIAAWRLGLEDPAFWDLR
ncbi:MAG: hypothetical protein NVSMB17_08530 [Candidatus Dormibacteria bacterium]